jgi:hypothetical protein
VAGDLVLLLFDTYMLALQELHRYLQKPTVPIIGSALQELLKLKHWLLVVEAVVVEHLITVVAVAQAELYITQHIL